jgi:hypothetical protein
MSGGDSAAPEQSSPEEVAFAYLYPDLFLDAHPGPAPIPANPAAYCAFCGRFLSVHANVPFSCPNPACGIITKPTTRPVDVLRDLIGPPPVRRTPTLRP